MKINLQDFPCHIEVLTLISTCRINKDPEYVYDVTMTVGIQSANPAVVRAGIYHPLTHFDETRKA